MKIPPAKLSCLSLNFKIINKLLLYSSQEEEEEEEEETS